MKNEKDTALEVLRLAAMCLKIQHLKCFALEMILRNLHIYYQSTRLNISEDLNFLLVLFDRNASGQTVSESLT